ncbi:MAG: excinuclease ABC subunit UvrC, partial [Thiovulaceae bacterium]|nr:excinuclease ABC subunit UvrC [Sulfurimonadaceae bacterium]
MIETLNALPKTPGIYQYFDHEGRLLYIGKAKNLFNRVRSYFSFTPDLHAKKTLSARIYKMITETVKMEYIVVDSEHDALILENSLIKQLNPKYNILLRDDKTYPYIVLDKDEAYPRFEITRKVHPSKSLDYFGPFTIGGRDILDSLYELFPLVQKKSCAQGNKACLYYQIDKCLAPCEGKVTKEDYAKIVKAAKDHILNKEKLMKLLKTKMLTLSEELRFEEANVLKERLLSIEKSHHKTAIDLAKTHNYDIFALAANEKQIVMVKMFMREGRIVSSSYIVNTIKEHFEKDEIYTRAIVDFYTSNETIIPKEILIFDALDQEDTQESLENTLSIQAKHKVSLINPQRGEKLKIIELAHKNALELLKKERKENKDHIQILEEIQELFRLEVFPQTIEVFDNSHLQGVARVGGMIAYHHGSYNKSHYRHYHLQAPDEYGQMRETLLKRIESFSKV